VRPQLASPLFAYHPSAAGPGEEQRLASRHGSGRLGADCFWRLPASCCRLGLLGAAQPPGIHR
jgi:hypothetical protein